MLAEVDRRRIPPSTHAGAYATHPRIRFAGVVENEPARVREIRALYPTLPVFRTPEALFKEGVPDLVSVATPPAARARVIRGLVQAGVKTILSEVPFAESMPEARKVVTASERSGALLLANHLRRCNPLVRKVRQRIRAGEIGEIVQIGFLYTGGLRSWGSHGLDLIVHLIGTPKRVHAGKSHTDSGHTGDPNVDGWLEFRNGVKAALLTTHFRDHRSFELDLIGRRGRIRLTDLGFRAEFFGLGQSKRFSQPELELKSREISTDSTFLPVVDHIVKCLNGVEKPLLGASEALRVAEVIEAMERSMKRGGAAVQV